MRGGYFRFTNGTDWDYSSWAGLGYSTSAKTIYLGIPGDGTIFQKNSRVDTNGKLQLVNISSITLDGASGNTYKIWHENNDGSGSGLDADLLDGTHKADLLTAASLGASGNNTTLSITVGGTTKTGSVTVPYATSAGNADTVDGHHQDHLLPYRYTYNAQTNSGSVWYVRIQTASYISEDCTIYVHGGGNNSSSDLVIHVLTRGNRFWGWQTSYNGCRIIGISKETGAPEIIYLKMPDSTTSISFKSTHSLTIDKADYSAKSYMDISSEGLFGNYILGKIQNADYAGSVDWANITNKPSSFTPSSHTHPFSQITDGTSSSTNSSWSHILSNTYGGS